MVAVSLPVISCVGDADYNGSSFGGLKCQKPEHNP